MDACTIIAKNYVAHARVLARSYARHHPDATFHVLVIDDHEGYIDPAAEPFSIVTPAQLDIDGFAEMAAIYDVLELSTAVKPWLLRWMLARSGGDGVLYLDPDMQVHAPLTDVFAAVRSHELVLSPHNLDAMPRDGKRPNEQDILIAGAYNLGFIGLGPGMFADKLLDWWAERLERDCIVDPSRGFFVDQRWIDLVPSMAERFLLLRDPGFNVAYWNLASRPVSRRDGTWWVAGDFPLRLFHFSGFDVREPHLLSKHQDRIRLSEHPDLAQLCREYADALLEEHALDVAAWPYTYGRTAGGVPLNIVTRRLYRELSAEGLDADVFTPDGEAAFVARANEPARVGGRQGVTRYLAALHAHRADLRRAYPDLERTEDADGYLGWAHVFGRVEIPIPDVLLDVRRPAHIEPAVAATPAAAAPPAAPAASDEPPPPLGVNVAGYLHSVLGVGEVARQAMDALETQGIPTLPIGVRAPLSESAHELVSLAPTSDGFPVNLVCVNADMTPSFAADAGPGFFAGRHTAGWWWWETSSFPERWHAAFEHVDEVWAGSRFVAETLSAVAPVPVVRIPTPVAKPHVRPMSREALGLPPGFVFLFSFDFHSVAARKNPLGLVEAFARAFPTADDGPSLVIKTINAEHHQHEAERLRLAAAGDPRIELLERYVPAAEKAQLLAACDCYVSLHRSEGFGFGMAEAMLLERPVIATGYSGNLDFMTEANSYLVRHALRPIGPGAEPYDAEGEWADPDLDHAAELMRHVVRHPEEAKARGERGARDVARTNSIEAAGAAMATRLRHVHAQMRRAARPDLAHEAQAQAVRAGELLRSGPGGVGGRRLRRARSFARRSVLRLIKPSTLHQEQIGTQLAAGLDNLAQQVAHMREQSEREAQRRNHADAAMLAQLRHHARRLDPGGAGALPGRIDELADRLDSLAAEVRGQDRVIPAAGYATPAPGEPWSHEYNGAHAAFVAAELDDAALLQRFREHEALPDRFGRGYDERVVEFPWVASRALRGRVLDAGSTLNHLHVLSRLRPRMDELHIVTLEPEERSWPKLGVSYLFADLRDLPLRDATYDRVLSISTLEHVGMDNTYYGSELPAGHDPQRECLRAARELRRVLRPGGELYVTVPVGRGERFAWVRSFTLAELDELADALAPASHALTFFRHDGARGWRRATAEEVTDARYRDHFTSNGPGPDRLVAAEAVACLHLVVDAAGDAGAV